MRACDISNVNILKRSLLPLELKKQIENNGDSVFIEQNPDTINVVVSGSDPLFTASYLKDIYVKGTGMQIPSIIYNNAGSAIISIPINEDNMKRFQNTVSGIKKNYRDKEIRNKYFPEPIQPASKILNTISRTNHSLAPLASFLSIHLKDDINIELVDEIPSQIVDIDAAGVYLKDFNKILILEDAQFKGIGSEPTILHEILHHMTHDKLRSDSKAAQDIEILYKHAEEQLRNSARDSYPLTNLDEFTVALFTNSRFIKDLRSLKPVDGIKYTNLFEEIMDYILGLFGMTPTDTLYDQSIAVLSNLIDNRESIKYAFKSSEVINKNIKTINSWEKNKNISEDQLWTKIQELGIPKDQLSLIRNSSGDTVEERLSSFLANYSYTIEINTAKKPKNYDNIAQGFQEVFDYNNSQYFYDEWDGYFKDGKKITKKEFEDAKQKSISDEPTQHYSNLTVPGGTNYTEDAHVIPVMKGKVLPDIYPHHDQEFANGNLNMYGWSRSDEVKTKDRVLKEIPIENDLPFHEIVEPEVGSKTRRILEVQSKFQKWRLNFEHKGNKYQILENQSTDKPNVFEDHYLENGKRITSKEYNKIFEEFLDTPTSKEDVFIKLIAKQWETMMIKSIIQDSAKKGYEKVLFPLGNTASLIEGHATLEGFKIQTEGRIKELENRLKNPEYIVDFVDTSGYSGLDLKFNTEQEALDYVKTENAKLPEDVEGGYQSLFNGRRLSIEIEQLKEELKGVETEGFGALKPIYNFYENTVANILKKQGYNPVEITDEFGNKWNEIKLDKKHYKPILLNPQETTQTNINPDNQELSQQDLDDAFLPCK